MSPTGSGLQHGTLAFRGTLVHTPTYGSLDILIDRLLIVSEGKIVAIAHGQEEPDVLEKWGIAEGKVRRLLVSVPRSPLGLEPTSGPPGVPPRAHPQTLHHAGWRVPHARAH